MRYLTEEELAEAKAKGLSIGNIYNRYYVLNWSVEDTINRPLNEYRPTKHKMTKTREANGISKHVYYRAINEGKTPEWAAKHAKPKKRGPKTNKFTKEQLATAEANGLKAPTIYNRVRKGMSAQDAVTKPLERRRKA